MLVYPPFAFCVLNFLVQMPTHRNQYDAIIWCVLQNNLVLFPTSIKNYLILGNNLLDHKNVAYGLDLTVWRNLFSPARANTH